MAVLDALRKFGRLVTPLQEPVRYGLLLSGGGARAAYQAGVLQYIGESFPRPAFPIIAGVSAGAINAASLAAHEGDLKMCSERLAKSWREIRPEQVFQAESSFSFLTGMLRRRPGKDDGWRAVLDTAPLREYLVEQLGAEDGVITKIHPKIRDGKFEAIAIITTNYGTGQTVTWVQGTDIDRWERPNRVGINTTLTVDHIMASTALPLLFPAIKIGDAYYGDGGIRLSAPLAPVVHLGANRILAITTRYKRSRAEADAPAFVGYPPVSQVFGLLLNAIFLDALDQDALTMDRINALLDQLPQRKRLGLRPVQLLLLRPSVDLGLLAGQFEPTVSGPLRLLARGFGATSTSSPDWLSMLLFAEPYVNHLMEIGFEDARRQHNLIAQFLDPSVEVFDRAEADLEVLPLETW